MRVFLACLLICASAVAAEVRVVDGDTLEMNGKVFRLNGIDAPEHGEKCGKWDCGAQSVLTKAEIVKGRDAGVFEPAQDLGLPLEAP